MAEANVPKKELLDEIVNRKKLGDKKFHSESSLQHFGEDDEASDSNKDPEVNESVNDVHLDDHHAQKRRAMSQPGPVSGSLSTATAGRAARRRPPKNVMYASNVDKNEYGDKLPKLVMPSKDEDLTPSTVFGDRASPSPLFYNGNPRNGDIKSLNKYASLSDLRSGTPRKRSVVTMDAQSLRSIETHAPPPTSPEDKAHLTKKHLTLILSIMYAVLLVTLGIIFYLADTFVEPNVSPIYNIVLTSIGLIYQIFMIVDITKFKLTALKNQKLRGLHEQNIADYFRKQEEVFGPTGSGDRTPENYKSPGVPSALLIPLKHNYCFSHGRHSGSFYLKLGAGGFAVGHLIHSILLITVQLNYYFDENIDNDECIVVSQVVYDFMNPIYCFIQLYFIFKYSNVIILRAKALAYFGFMHMIGSSLCFWISTIVRETILALTIYANSIYGKNRTEVENTTSNDYYPSGHIQTHSDRFLDVGSLYNENCQASVTINSILENFSPYLYPFSVEFNILIVAFYYIIWSHIGQCHNENSSVADESSSTEDNNTVCKIPTANEDNDFTSNMVIYADCHASNKGLFLGLVFMVLVVGQLIIGFIFSSVGEDTFLELGYLLNDCTRLAMHAIMLIGAFLAYNQIRKLDVNEHPMSLLDDVLLFICKPAFFMETVFTVVATVNILNVVKTVDALLMVIQVIVQTTLLIDGIRRCSNSKKLRRQKPGRELLMFLLIANVGMWLMNTFSYKSPESLDERYSFYGKVAWSILGHVSLPLIMFYRFHSSVCFADIWDYAYKPGSDH
ncbi:proton channel OtopLc-like [Epargyreus clarus]|uniref:proton channel OtopLc-like n=1 Tax=Epargyreus clarus TaxID=520877 RepID=UPI003C2B5F37